MVIAEVLVVILALLIGIPFGIVAVIYLIVPTCKGIGWCFKQVFRFIGGVIVDTLRLIGSIFTGLVFIPFTLVNVLFGRWSAAAHYGRAIEGEGKAMLGCAYRIFIGHPARLFCLTPLTEGIEKRLPQAVALAPGADTPRGRAGQFDGYTIIGSLPGGGSGSRLYIAEPTAGKLQALIRAGRGAVDRVVIKSFSLAEGSTLPQIVRENRALAAAAKMGLILEHELSDERFFYVTCYVPGESLGVVTQRLHASSSAGGLANPQVIEVASYARDIASTLADYHSGGLWHKDVKPDNIIISEGRAHLVDFGLVTPLRSSMTLTTHGTEYFRDPEMVRMALRGVKVHEVDGARFDVYALGAVLYSMIENSFPAHGGLSQITRRCPEGLRWIVRRAMTDYDKRYASARDVLIDLSAVLAASDPFAVKPIDLPSMQSGGASSVPDSSVAGGAAPNSHDASARSTFATGERPPNCAFASTGTPFATNVGAVTSPRLCITDWWTGKYRIEHGPEARGAAPFGAEVAAQLANAREHARRAQDIARKRLRGYRKSGPGQPNKGVAIALGLFVIIMFTSMIPLLNNNAERRDRARAAVAEQQAALEAAGLPIVVAPVGDAVGTPEPVASSDGQRERRNAKSMTSRATGKTSVAATGSVETVGPIAPNARILVLADGLSFPVEDQPRLDKQLERLEKAGFELHGLIRKSMSDDATSATHRTVDADTELLAALKAAIAIAPLGSSDARDAIMEWLNEHPAFDMVLWIGRDEDAKPAGWIVGRKALSTDVTKAAERALRNQPSGDRSR
jgi:serine/threonine protein kinase